MDLKKLSRLQCTLSNVPSTGPSNTSPHVQPDSLHNTYSFHYIYYGHYDIWLFSIHFYCSLLCVFTGAGENQNPPTGTDRVHGGALPKSNEFFVLDENEFERKQWDAVTATFMRFSLFFFKERINNFMSYDLSMCSVHEVWCEKKI